MKEEYCSKFEDLEQDLFLANQFVQSFRPRKKMRK